MSKLLLKNTFFKINVYALICICIVDLVLIRNSNFLFKQFDVNSKIDFFVAFTGVYLLLQLILAYTLAKNDLFMAKDRGSKLIRKFIIIVQIVISANVILIISEILSSSHYHTVLASLAIGLSYSGAIILLGFVIIKFIHWYKLNKLNKTLILYALSTSALLSNIVISILFFEFVLVNMSPINPTGIGQTFIYMPSGSFLKYLYDFQFVSTAFSFSLLWYTTFKFLYGFLVKRKVHFMLILLLPLLFFIFQYLVQYSPYLLNYFLTLSFFERNIYILGTTMTKPIGGLLFGIIFLILSNKIPKQFHLHDYLIIASLGLFLLFATNQASLLSMSPFPPFGIVSASSLLLATYFYLVGITFSVKSISENSELRNIVRKITKEYQIRLLDDISSADILSQIESDVLKKVDKVEKEKPNAYVVDEDEIKQYVIDVLNEIKNKN